MLGIFLDTETSGLNPKKHCILELAFKILDVQTGEIKDSFQQVIKQNWMDWVKSDSQSLEVNGFTWEEISLGMTPSDTAEKILFLFDQHQIQKGKAVFICQNPSFDRAFFSQLIDPDLQEALHWPYHWLDLASMYWALHVYRYPPPWQTGVSKDKISQTYFLAPEAKPHRAMNGVNHLIQCYEAVVGFPLAKSNCPSNLSE